MSLAADILTYGNRAQTKIAELGVLVEEQLRQGIDYSQASEQAMELIMFQKSLLNTLCPWSDEDKAKWIAWMTDRHELAPIPYVPYDLYVSPIVRFPDTGSGDFVTHAQLDDAVGELEAEDSALDARITALENYDYSELIPQTLLDDVAETKSGLETALDLIDEIQDDVLDIEDDLAAHIADTSKHIQPGERAAWNAKVSAADLASGLAGKANTSHTHSISHVTGLQAALDDLQNEINNFPEPEDGDDGVTPNISIGFVETTDTPYVEIDSGSTPEAPILNFGLPKGEPGQDFEFDATDLFANRSDYDDSELGFKFLAYDTGNYYVMGNSGWGPAIPFRGHDGWSPKIALYTVSPTKEVIEIVGWIGGTGAPPQFPLLPGQDPETTRFFVAETGVVNDPALAKNVKGSQGNDGPVTPFIINEQGTDRSIYDAQSRGFSFLDTTDGTVYFKVSDTNADWSDGYPWIGPPGEDGDDSTVPGPAGDSAYDVAVANGFVGTEEEWLESLVGPPGDGADATLDEVLTNGNDAGAQQIKNLANGSDAQDAVTKSQMESAISSASASDVSLLRQNLGLTAHGFSVGDCLTLDAGDFVKISDPSSEVLIGIVIDVVDANNFLLQLGGWSAHLNLASGVYYVQSDGSLNTTPTELIGYVSMLPYWGYIPARVPSSNGGGGGAGAPAREVFAFNSTLFTEDSKLFRGVITDLEGYASDELSAVSFEVRLASSSTWTAQSTISDVETWIGSNISGDASSGTKFWIKVLGTYSGSGLAQYVMTYTI